MSLQKAEISADEEKELIKKIIQSGTGLPKLRIREVDTSKLPYINEIRSIQKVLLVDKFVEDVPVNQTIGVTRDYTALNDDNMGEEDQEFNTYGCRIAGNPLKFQFLTLDKLNKLTGSDDINYKDTLTMIGKHTPNFTYDLQPLESEYKKILDINFCEMVSKVGKYRNMPLVVAFKCAGDRETNGLLFKGSRRPIGKALETLTTNYLGTGIDLLANLDIQIGNLGGTISPVQIECKYDLYPAIEPVDEDIGSRVSAQFSVIGKWTSTQITPMPSHPSNSAEMYINFVAGFYDRRMQDNMRSYDLHRLIETAVKLEAGQTNFHTDVGNDDEVMTSIEKWMDENPCLEMVKMGDRSLDFIELLWDKIKETQSMTYLAKIIAMITSKISSKTFKANTHPDNNCMLAILLREPERSSKLLGRLENLYCTQIFTEIGYEFVFREIVDGFNQLQFAKEQEGRKFYEDIFFLEGSIEDKVMHLTPYHLGLQFAKLLVATFENISPYEYLD
uniref:Protein kinase domain-containing protein n=1 Tax=Rhabditophanes sp. KR3021 TaxID=114890 RepID=A0AC35TIW4_9BILA